MRRQLRSRNRTAHSHRDLLPGNYDVARRAEPEGKFFNDFSRARACARARGCPFARTLVETRFRRLLFKEFLFVGCLGAPVSAEPELRVIGCDNVFDLNCS